MIPRNKLEEYNELAQNVAKRAWAGQRVYLPEPYLTHSDRTGGTVCTVLRIRAPVDVTALYKMADIEFPEIKGNYADLYIQRLVDSIKTDTWATNNTPFEGRFETWPLNSYEEWLSEEHKNHWATAQTYTEPNGTAILISVFAPVTRVIEDYQYEYGSAIVMTKLGIGL